MSQRFTTKKLKKGTGSSQTASTAKEDRQIVDAGFRCIPVPKINCNGCKCFRNLAVKCREYRDRKRAASRIQEMTGVIMSDDALVNVKEMEAGGVDFETIDAHQGRSLSESPIVCAKQSEKLVESKKAAPAVLPNDTKENKDNKWNRFDSRRALSKISLRRRMYDSDSESGSDLEDNQTGVPRVPPTVPVTKSIKNITVNTVSDEEVDIIMDKVDKGDINVEYVAPDSSSSDQSLELTEKVTEESEQQEESIPSIGLVKSDTVKSDTVKSDTVKSDEVTEPKVLGSETVAPEPDAEEKSDPLSAPDPLTEAGADVYDSSSDEVDSKYQLVYNNLKVIRSIKTGDKLCVDYGGKLSIDNSYLPSVSRTLYRNNKVVTIDRVDDTIKVGKQIKKKVGYINRLFDPKLTDGLNNLANTYESTDDFRDKLQALANSI